VQQDERLALAVNFVIGVHVARVHILAHAHPIVSYPQLILARHRVGSLRALASRQPIQDELPRTPFCSLGCIDHGGGRM
jgi:hypothetical protein